MLFRLFNQLKHPIKNSYRLPVRALSDQITVKEIDLVNFPPEKIRNFSIVAHIDHGKSTLADRILEMVGNIDTASTNKQVLDSLQVEKERGITVKAQSASVLYNYQGEDYILNMIDTPGHVDFSYEVTRSLRACQGVVLLVDANQGVQAQTVSNFYLAFANDLEILAVMNKIDLPGADPEGVKVQLRSLFDMEEDQVLAISAKMGIGVKELLDRVVERVPPPTTLGTNASLRLFMFDSWFDRYQGAIQLVQVADGVLTAKNTVVSTSTKKEYKVKEVGLMTPFPHPCPALYPGQVGYLISNMRTAKEAVIGDTFYAKDKVILETQK